MVDSLAQWAADEFADSKYSDPRPTDTSKWPRHYPTAIPWQRNGSDCGVFAIQVASQHKSQSFCHFFFRKRIQYLPDCGTTDIPSVPWLLLISD